LQELQLAVLSFDRQYARAESTRVVYPREIAMEILLLFVTVVLAIAIFAIAGFWFFRESKEREQRREQARSTRAAEQVGAQTPSAPAAWDGGIKTSPRQLR
jgi:flagellar basal body-associated protein FliL